MWALQNNFMRYLRDYELYRRKGTGAKKRGRPPKVRAPSTSTSSASKDSSTSRCVCPPPHHQCPTVPLCLADRAL